MKKELPRAVVSGVCSGENWRNRNIGTHPHKSNLLSRMRHGSLAWWNLSILAKAVPVLRTDEFSFLLHQTVTFISPTCAQKKKSKKKKFLLTSHLGLGRQWWIRKYSESPQIPNTLWAFSNYHAKFLLTKKKKIQIILVKWTIPKKNNSAIVPSHNRSSWGKQNHCKKDSIRHQTTAGRNKINTIQQSRKKHQLK